MGRDGRRQGKVSVKDPRERGAERVVRGVEINWLRLPLHTPYKLSYRTFTEFEPFLVTVRDTDGNTGWGEAHISPGSSKETREGGWAFCTEQIARLHIRRQHRLSGILHEYEHAA